MTITVMDVIGRWVTVAVTEEGNVCITIPSRDGYVYTTVDVERWKLLTELLAVDADWKATQ